MSQGFHLSFRMCLQNYWHGLCRTGSVTVAAIASECSRARRRSSATLDVRSWVGSRDEHGVLEPQHPHNGINEPVKVWNALNHLPWLTLSNNWLFKVRADGELNKGRRRSKLFHIFSNSYMQYCENVTRAYRKGSYAEQMDNYRRVLNTRFVRNIVTR